MRETAIAKASDRQRKKDQRKEARERRQELTTPSVAKQIQREREQELREQGDERRRELSGLAWK